MAAERPGVSSSCDVLVLDGETRPALAVVRSLGARGLNIKVAAPSKRSLAAGSRFASSSIVLPDPRKSSGAYLGALLHHVNEIRPKTVLPISDLTTDLLLEHRSSLPKEVGIPGVDHHTFRAVAEKSALLRRAESLGVHVPSSILLEAPLVRAEAKAAVESFAYPGVLKPETSEQQVGGEFKKPPVRYVQSDHEVESLLARPEHAGLRFLLQQQIEGPGVGVFALCLRGRPLATFCHRRILEKPPSGGRSVLSESIAESDAPVAEAHRLLRDLLWEGVAMVEFKAGPNGAFYLMEINPRFWGSLQLAIDCGRDFPFLLYRLFEHGADSERRFEELLPTILPYRTGKRLRWDLGCLDHALIRLKESPLKAIGELTLRNSLRLFSRPRNTGHETFRLTDPVPFVYELLSYGRELFR